MTEELDTGRSRKLSIYAWIIVPVALLVGLLVMTIFRGGIVKKDQTPEATRKENHLANVRHALARHHDLTTCKNVVAELNNHIQATDKIPQLTPEQKSRLKEELKLSDGDMGELNSATFTPLDARHLETCFLLREAARSLELVPPSGRGGKPITPSPLDRAKLAFDWVCRQVRLMPTDEGALPAPPGFVLRRGSGSALERAVVFLALLEQFGLLQDEKASLQGCLLTLPGNSQLWACGVVLTSEPGSIYLFDPRLGLPLPGPSGKGIATLKQAREDPGVLKQLRVDGFFFNHTYDIDAEKAKSAVAHVFAPLNALSPRMRILQDKWLRDRQTADGQALPAAVRIKVAEEEPGARAAVRAAFAASGGKEKDVTYWPEGAKLLREFVSVEEGGADTGVRYRLSNLQGFTVPSDLSEYRIPRAVLAELVGVPWEGYPAVFRGDFRAFPGGQFASFNPRDFRYDRGLGHAIRGVYAGYFLRELRDSNSPRGQILRGQFGAATAQELVRELEMWQQARLRRLDPEEMARGLLTWLTQAIDAYAAQEVAGGPKRDADADAQVAKVWRWKPNDPAAVLMLSSAADYRGAEVTWQLGLCKHEEAIRVQGRLDLAARAGVKTTDDENKAKSAWELAAYWWKQYLENYPGQSAAPAVRRLQGEAQVGMGKPALAVETWSDTSGMSDLEALGVLWRAKQFE